MRRGGRIFCENVSWNVSPDRSSPSPSVGTHAFSALLRASTPSPPAEYSDLWRKLLAQPDSEIIGAFAPPPADAAQAALFAGVTRRSVTEHLQRWQKECNSTLKDGASNSMSGRYKGKPAEVTIFP